MMRLSWLALVLVLAPTACPERSRPARPLPELRRAAAAARDPREALELVEAVKCRELRERLLRAGAAPHALPEVDRARLPALAADEALLSLAVVGPRLERRLALEAARAGALHLPGFLKRRAVIQ